jgi:surface protein
MSEMFHYSYNLTELDLSKFDMSNVTNTDSMFYLDFKLQVIRFDNVSFDAVTSYSYMFYQVPGVIVVKDETAKNWVLTKPLAQNYYGTTVKTVAEYESQ